MIVLVTGGISSGKSNFAQNKCLELGEKISYIATSVVTDEDMEKKVQKHRENRPSIWHTYESYNSIDEIIEKSGLSEDTYILDCISNLISNFYFYSKIDFDHASNNDVETINKEILIYMEKILKVAKKNNKNLVIVSNEVGFSVVSEYRMTRFFVDIQGKVNQLISSYADEVFLTVSGIALKIK